MADSDFSLPAASTDDAPSLGGKGTGPSDAPRLGGEAALARLIDALRDDDSAIREKAAEALGGRANAVRPDRRVVDLLLGALADRSASVRMRATQALGNLHETQGDPRIHEAVIAALRDPAAGVRRGAAGALAKIGGAAVAQELFALLRDGDTGVQAAAVEALGAIGETLDDHELRVKIVRALLELPSRTPYGMYQRALRAAIPPAIARIGEASLPVLLETLERYNRASEIASEALGIIAIQATNPVLRTHVVMSLLATAWEPDVLLADAVVRGLGSIIPRLPDAHLFDRVITELLDLFHATGPMLLEVHDGVPETIAAYLEGRRLDYLRPTLIQTLGRLGAASDSAARRTAPVLIEATYDLDPLVWLHALGELRQIAAVFPEEAAAAIPALVRHLGDHSQPALHEAPRSELAAAVLRQIGTEEALGALNGWGRGKAE